MLDELDELAAFTEKTNHLGGAVDPAHCLQ